MGWGNAAGPGLACCQEACRHLHEQLSKEEVVAGGLRGALAALLDFLPGVRGSSGGGTVRFVLIARPQPHGDLQTEPGH